MLFIVFTDSIYGCKQKLPVDGQIKIVFGNLCEVNIFPDSDNSNLF